MNEDDLKAANPIWTTNTTDNTLGGQVRVQTAGELAALRHQLDAQIYNGQLAGAAKQQQRLTLDRFDDTELVMEMLSRGFVVMRAKDLEGKL
jgi:demethoxyubiquinone hydroxylase (CLK1/Coq7/Cat5 family)